MLKTIKARRRGAVWLCIFKGYRSGFGSGGEDRIPPQQEERQNWSEANQGSCGGKINRSNGVSTELGKARRFFKGQRWLIFQWILELPQSKNSLLMEHGLGWSLAVNHLVREDSRSTSAQVWFGSSADCNCKYPLSPSWTSQKRTTKLRLLQEFLLVQLSFAFTVPLDW